MLLSACSVSWTIKESNIILHSKCAFGQHDPSWQSEAYTDRTHSCLVQEGGKAQAPNSCIFFSCTFRSVVGGEQTSNVLWEREDPCGKWPQLCTRCHSRCPYCSLERHLGGFFPKKKGGESPECRAASAKLQSFAQ